MTASPVFRIDHPVVLQRFVLQAVVLDGAVGHDRGRDIEHHRRFLAGGNSDRQRIGAEHRFSTAGKRHVVGIRDSRIKTHHVGLQRQRGIDPRRAGVTGHAAPDPGNTAFARELNRGFRSTGHHQMTHAIVAVDERGRRRCAVDRNVGPGIGRTELQTLDILHQAEHAMRIGADEICLEHEPRNFSRVILRHAGLAHRVDDQACDCRRWNSGGFGGLNVHGFPSKASAPVLKIVVLSASEIFRERTCFTQSIMPMS